MAGPWEVASETPAPAPPSGGGWEVASEAPAIEEVTPTMTPAVAKPPIPQERPASAPASMATVAPTEPAPPVQPLDEAKPGVSSHNAFMRGLVSGTLESNPQMAAEAMESWSHLAPEQFKESLQSASRDLHSVSKLNPAEYKTQSKGMWNIAGIDDALTWAGETLGQGIASTVPSAVTGVGGAVVGGRVGGKTGATIGGLGAATVPSMALNTGEIYKALKEEKVKPEDAAGWANAAGALSTAFDVGSLGSIVGFGAKEIKSELNKAIAKTIVAGITHGVKTEGITESIQEVIKDATVSLKAGKPFWTLETAKGAIEAGVGGALTGGVMGGGTSVVGAVLPGGAKVGPDGVPIPEQVTVTPEQIAAQVAAGGITVDPAEVHGPPEMYGPPKPTNTPVTTAVQGVETTSITEGVADAYTMIFGPGGKPQMAPAAVAAAPTPTPAPSPSNTQASWTSMDPAAFADAVSVEMDALYGGQDATLHQAFHNGANGVAWDVGMPAGTQFEDVLDAYQAGDEFAGKIATQYPPAMATNPVAAFDEIDYADPWAQEVYAHVTKLFPLVDGGMTPQAAAFENGAHGLPWDMGLPSGVPQSEVAMAYSSGAAFAIMKGPQAQAAQRAIPAWTQSGSPSDVAAFSAAYVMPTHEVTRRPLTANPETNPEWTKGQEQTVPGPRTSYTELSVQTPSEEGLVVMPITVRETVDGQPVALVEGMPAVPSEVGFLRSALWALRNNIRRIAWTGGYAPFARKLARKLGGTMGSTRVPINRPKVVEMPTAPDPVTGVTVPLWGVVNSDTGQVYVTTPDRSAAEEIAEKNSTYSEVPVLTLPHVAISTVQMPTSYSPETFSASQGASMGASSAAPLSKASVEPLVQALNRLIKRLDLGITVKVIVHDGPITYQEYNHTTKKMETVVKNGLGLARSMGKTAQSKIKVHADIARGEIHVSLLDHHSAEGVWATLTHEMGHLIMNTIYHRASTAVKNAVHAAYVATYFSKMNVNLTMDEVYQLQSTAAFMVDRVLNGQTTSVKLGQLTQAQVDYWTGFSEWFAEQVAKWATTSEKPLSIVEKFFKGMANRLMAMLKVASDMFGMHYEAVPELKAFLDSALKSEVVQAMGPQVATQTTQETTNKNATQMEPEDVAVEGQTETQPAMDGINGVFGGRPPKEAQTAKAYADRFNWAWKIFTGIHQLAAANPHISSLMAYVETVRVAQQVKQAIMTQAQDNLEKWNNLGETQANAVSALIDDVQALNFLTDEEKKRKVSRHPTMAELTAMAQKHGVTARGLAVYAEVGKSFQDFLTRLEDVGKSEAMKISDETRRDLKLAGIAKQIAALRSKPYFPAMRFGSYTLTIRNAAKKVIHFETFESERTRRSAMNAIASQYGVSPNDMQVGFMDKSMRPLLGVPTALLEFMGEKLNLNATQKDALEQLKYELSPAESFKHRFQHKKRVAGYSMDFRRAYANYFFHGANHLMKAKFADRLEALTKMAKAEVANEPDVTKRDKIVAQMNNHTEAWLDPKPDWASVSSWAFLLNLAFSPAAAMQNLSQTLLTTHPFLASKFGHTNSIPAMMKAIRSLETFYKKRTLEKHSNFTQKALYQGMQDGTIQETQAVQLAGIADGDILGKGFGGNKRQRAWVKFNEWGSYMFQMAEQTNRRLVFRAALELAMAHPSAKYVTESIARNKLTYDQRRAEGWTEAEAAAYVTAVDATKETQFEYGKEFAPRVMRGRSRSILVFKTFQQSYWMFLVNNPGARYESLLILAFLGGFLGLPWAEDLQQLLQALAYQIFGKDFKLDHEARKWIIELLGSNEAGDATADIMMHGIAKRGYGIPHLMDMIAGTVKIDNPMPTFDRSKAIAGGTFLPVELGKLLGAPLQSTEKVVSQQAQKASGAVFGYAFAAYSAMRNTQLSWTDFKRWESMMPRAAANVSRAWRAASEGGSRTNTGGQIVEYNVRDPQGAAEIIGMAMGYRPYRENYEWEKAMSKHDAAKMIDIRREQVMRQFGNAVLGKDPDERAKMTQAVRDFNAGLQPEERGKAITSDSLSKSVETKARDRALQERGLPTKKGDIPIYREEDKLYPGQHRTLRKVPGGMTP